MSQTTPHRPRHARPDDPADVAAPVFTDAATVAIPAIIPAIIPAQRTAGPLFVPSGETGPVPGGPGSLYLYPAEPAPAGLHPRADVPAPRPRRLLPAVLAVVTAALLASGIAVGLGGAADADARVQPVPAATP